MDTRFAITEYPNAAALTAQLDALIKKPIYSISRAALKEYEEEYSERAYRQDHEYPDYEERTGGRYGYRRRMR